MKQWPLARTSSRVGPRLKIRSLGQNEPSRHLIEPDRKPYAYDIGPESSLVKLFWSELDVRIHETALGLLGERATVDSDWLDGFEFSLSGPIYAGTNEVQRNVVAERVLGLPRA